MTKRKLERSDVSIVETYEELQYQLDNKDIELSTRGGKFTLRYIGVNEPHFTTDSMKELETFINKEYGIRLLC